MRWLSEGMEELVRDCEQRDKAAPSIPHFEVVIVGSGYGGALAAAELSGTIDPTRICVLERGREYLAGMFPSSEADLPGNISFNAPNSPDPYVTTDGVLDLRLGEDVSVMLASGLGGGSLINAGVMARPEDWVFKQPCWPKALQDPKALRRWYVEARRRLRPDNRKSKFDKPEDVKKREALFRLHPEDEGVRKKLKVGAKTKVDSYIAAKDATNPAGVPLKACTRCGDCMTGCNHQAKNSLDQNLLVQAKRRGVRIFCGATVVKLKRGEPGQNSSPWVLELVHTDPLLRRREDKPFPLSARRVVLAAGTLGSTEILLRSRNEHLTFSWQLGQRFSTNGDFIAASYGERKEVNAVATETQPFQQREVGPTITGMMKVGEGEDQITIEELAIPGSLRRLFSEGFTTSHLFHRLDTGDPEGTHRPHQGGVDPYAVSPEKIARTQVLGVIGHDGAKGRLELRASKHEHEHDHAYEAGLPDYKRIAVHWPELRDRGGIFDRQVAKLEKLVNVARNGGVLLANPFWQLLPPGMTQLLEMPRGPALTTHPLGGCPMADTWQDGVVDEYGQVFDTQSPTSVHDGLVVLDGAIIPRSLGTNPAFTISAVVLRALNKLKVDWKTGSSGGPDKQVLPMPSFKTAEPARDIPTQIAIHERLEGELCLDPEAPKGRSYTLDLTLEFKPASVRDLATAMTRILEVDPKDSYLRVFDTDLLNHLRDKGEGDFTFDTHAEFRMPLRGTMRLLDREGSCKVWRIIRGLYAWVFNRGLRDLWNTAVDYLTGKKRGSVGDIFSSFWHYITGLLHLASHAGEARLFEYNLIVSGPRIGALNAGSMEIPEGTLIRGTKRLTYARRSNPWTQMLEVTLSEISAPPGVSLTGWFPKLSAKPPTVLKLEPKHYARERRHLFEITRERDGATGMFELFSFVLHVTRIVAAIHLWSFRKPDDPSNAEPQRLPGQLPGIPPPVIDEIRIKSCDDETNAKREVTVRLTRYRNDGPNLPVLLIHGYSASGTTFAHPALRPGLAEYLYKSGRDVWVVDLRTSAGLPSSKLPWSFEQVAKEDIPKVFEHILAETGRQKIDVVAHCMGAAMFSMSLLRERDHHLDIVPHVRNVVLSQVGPMVVFTPANVFRAYAVSYIQQVIRESNFEFRPKPGLGGAFLDRLLTTVPYPRDEFDFENPLIPWRRTSFTGTRHRMDAWFGRAFNVANMDDGMLEHIDDFFGAINLRTLFQTIHFARNCMITTKRGGNLFLDVESLQRLKPISFFSIHGADNGLADPATLVRMKRLMRGMEIPFQHWKVPGYGHQDCVMGRDAPTKIFPEIQKFLESTAPDSVTVGDRDDPAPAGSPHNGPLSDPAIEGSAHLPFMGPLVGLPDARNEITVAFASDPKFGEPAWFMALPVTTIDDTWRGVVLDELRQGRLRTARLVPQLSHSAVAGIPKDMPQWYRCLIGPDMPRAFVIVLIGGALAPMTKMPWVAFPQTLEQLPTEITKALSSVLRRASVEELQRAQVVLPEPGVDAGTLRFAVGSCQYPAGPLDPGIAAASYARLGERLDSDRPPRCAVLMGDQIYADATAGLFDPTQMDDRYELPYEEWLRTSAVRDVLRRLPLYATFDDHEIDNNWEWGISDPKSEKYKKDKERRAKALDAFFRIQRAAVREWTATSSNQAPNAAFPASIDGFDFFFADGRSERAMRTVATLDTSEMLGAKQRKALSDWLDRTNNTSRPRFVAAASILVPRRKLTSGGRGGAIKAGAINSDAWDGYPATLQWLLAYIANRDLRNLVFLSGDEHHSCIATARLACLDGQGNEVVRRDKKGKEFKETVLHSIHSSGLYAPFVFANGEPADLAGTETFTFENPELAQFPTTRRIRCVVSTQFVAALGDGFAMLECGPSMEGDWQIECEFSRPPRSETQPDSSDTGPVTETYELTGTGCKQVLRPSIAASKIATALVKQAANSVNSPSPADSRPII